MSATRQAGEAEPEIDALGRFATVGLRILRGFAVLAGLALIGLGVWLTCDPAIVYQTEVPPLPTRIAHQMTFVCVGLPFVLPIAFTIGKGWRYAFGLGAMLWFGPSFLPGDPVWGFGVRMFATLVAIAALLVWRTLAGLSNPTRTPQQAEHAAGEHAADDRVGHPEAELGD